MVRVHLRLEDDWRGPALLVLMGHIQMTRCSLAATEVRVLSGSLTRSGVVLRRLLSNVQLLLGVCIERAREIWRRLQRIQCLFAHVSYDTESVRAGRQVCR